MYLVRSLIVPMMKMPQFVVMVCITVVVVVTVVVTVVE